MRNLLFRLADLFRHNTLGLIQGVIAICTLIGGVYVFSPLYQDSVAAHGPGILDAALTHPAMIYFWAGVLAIAAIFILVGLSMDKSQLRSVGCFAIFLARMFQAATAWLTIGLLPFSGWIYPLTIALVMLILWARERSEINDASR